MSEHFIAINQTILVRWRRLLRPHLLVFCPLGRQSFQRLPANCMVHSVEMCNICKLKLQFKKKTNSMWKNENLKCTLTYAEIVVSVQLFHFLHVAVIWKHAYLDTWMEHHFRLKFALMAIRHFQIIFEHRYPICP